MLEALQQIAGISRQVSTKAPNVGVREALEHWDTVAEIIRTLVRIRAENTPPPRTHNSPAPHRGTRPVMPPMVCAGIAVVIMTAGAAAWAYWNPRLSPHPAQ